LAASCRLESISTDQYIAGVRLGWPRFPGRLWLRNYYEHIVRNEAELNHIRQYVIDNPKQWELDRENPAVAAKDKKP
jgi:REP element-mobilizing transposase RayT